MPKRLILKVLLNPPWLISPSTHCKNIPSKKHLIITMNKNYWVHDAMTLFFKRHQLREGDAFQWICRSRVVLATLKDSNEVLLATTIRITQLEHIMNRYFRMLNLSAFKSFNMAIKFLTIINIRIPHCRIDYTKYVMYSLVLTEYISCTVIKGKSAASFVRIVE